MRLCKKGNHLVANMAKHMLQLLMSITFGLKMPAGLTTRTHRKMRTSVPLRQIHHLRHGRILLNFQRGFIGHRSQWFIFFWTRVRCGVLDPPRWSDDGVLSAGGVPDLEFTG